MTGTTFSHRTPAHQPTQSPPLVAIALISASVLGCEILLMRLFSIIQWHHFAYMMISLALLGYGVAGTFTTLFRKWLEDRYAAVFVTNAALFGLAAVAAFILAQRVPFNALEIFWDPHQPLHLLQLYLLLFVPFFFAANCICLTFVCHGHRTHRIYSADLTGAAAGCLLVVGLLFVMMPMRALQVFGALGLAAAAVAALHFRLHTRVLLPLLALAAAVLLFALPPSMTALHISPYKGLRQALLVDGARVIEQRSSPLGLLTVVVSPRVPFRDAPGLSLNAVMEPPEQLGVFTDGDSFSALTRFDGDPGRLGYLDQMTSALPYHLLPAPHVLVLGAGAGADVLQAVEHGARRIDAVELNPQLVDLVRKRYADFDGHLYTRPDVRVHVAEARGFVSSSREHYDLIQVALLDPFGASVAGLYGLSESYLYTVEGFRSYLRHLQPDGILAITRWVSLPPRDTLKLFATAVAALKADGVTDPGSRLALIRGWQTITLLIGNRTFGDSDVAAIRRFCQARAFDTAWYPGIGAADVNHFNRLDVPWFHQGAAALLGNEATSFIARYKFNIEPATDDRPYFFNFFRWRTLPEILSLKQRGGLPLLELGYPVLVATLLQALLASTLLILLPLWVKRSRQTELPRWRVFAYFAGLGLAFMFIEMAFIQKFTLLLTHPLYAVSVVLCTFLLFAGIGSRRAELMKNRIVWPVLGIALLSAIYLPLLPLLFQMSAALPDMLKIALSAVLIAPLAYCMGMPFPLGMAALANRHAPAIPWAYGINACASVIGATLATVLAIHFGFTGVILLAVALYGMAALTFPGKSAPSLPRRVTDERRGY